MLSIIEKLEEDIRLLKSSIEQNQYVPQFIHTDKVHPNDGQAVWVKHRNGAEYRLTYPFNHKDYPLWYPLPKD